MAKKKAENVTKVYPQITDTSIDVTGCELVNLSGDMARLGTTRDGFEEAAQDAFQQALASPGVLGFTAEMQAEVTASQSMLEDAMVLLEAEKWLQKHLTLVNETRRLYLSRAAGTAKKVVQRARLLAEESPEAATAYAALIEHYAKPAKKAASTKRRKKTDTSVDANPSNTTKT